MSLKRLFAAAVFIALIFGTSSASAADEPPASETHFTTIAGLKVAYWLPGPGSLHPAPLIIYSHGIGGCAAGAQYLTEALAQHGYVVVAPNHRDSSCGGNGVPAGAMEFFYKPEMWDASTYRDRGRDIRKLAGALKKSRKWSARIDWSKIGLMGHSLGGYTVLALAGAQPGWKLKGVRAVLALAPYTAPLLGEGHLDALRVPVMYQTAALDADITALVKNPDGAFDKTPAPAWLVEFDGADHVDFNDFKGADDDAERAMHIRDDIATYSAWFFDHTLRGASGPPDGGTTLRNSAANKGLRSGGGMVYSKRAFLA